MNENINDKPTSIQDQAARWVVRLNRGELSKEDAFALEDWLSESAAHRDTLQALGQVWLDSGQVQLPRPTSESISLVAVFGAWANLRPTTAWGGLVAACLVMVVVLAGTMHWIDSSGVEQIAVQTAIGENRLVELADGSSIHLNTNTQIETDFKKSVRSVKLLRGEALFRVAKDMNRPFRVYVGRDMVEAVGTAFRIRATEATEVTVTEGRVKLVLPRPEMVVGNAAGGSDRHVDVGEWTAQVGAGRTAVFETDRVVVKEVSTEVIEKELSWRQGMLRFDGDTLADVVSEFGRFTETQITLDDDIRNTRIVGYFNAGDTDRFVNALRMTFHIASKSQGMGSIHLYLLPDDDISASHPSQDTKSELVSPK